MTSGETADVGDIAVLDASAVFELVLRTPAGSQIRRRLADPAISLHSPELVDLEVLNVIRRYVQANRMAPDLATAAVRSLSELDLHRHRHGPMLRRIWERRSNLTAYDAAYVALAEILDGPLLTTDRRLARAPNLRIPVEVYAGDDTP